MNIMFSASFVFFDAAILTGKPVSFAGHPALRFPRWAVISFIAAPPRWIAFTLICDANAGIRTIFIGMCAGYVAPIDDDFFTTRCAVETKRFFVGYSLSGFSGLCYRTFAPLSPVIRLRDYALRQAQTASFIMTFAAAKDVTVFCSLGMRWAARELLATHRASMFPGFIKIPPPKNIGTFAGASLLPALLYEAYRNLIFSIANRTYFAYHFHRFITKH